MPYAQTPWVKRGKLITDSGQPILVGSPAWFEWLQTAGALGARFCYSPDHTTYRFTARKEKRRNQLYWFGYLKCDRKLHNVYLGKTERLTQNHLDQACDRLVQKVQQSTKETPSR